MIKAKDKFKYQYLLPSVLRFFNLGGYFSWSSNESKEPNNLFLVGSGRNGSTLMAMLLNRHSNCFLPSEQYALPYTIHRCYLSKLKFKKWDTLVEEVVHEYKEKNNNWDFKEGEYAALIEELKTVGKEKQYPSYIFNSLFSALSKSSSDSLKVIGDHSPVTSLHYKIVAREFPKAKFIILVRHPYDVILSHSKMGDATITDPNYVVFKLNDSLRMYDWLSTNNYDVKLLRYEDLVREPKKVTNEVQDFLDLATEDLVDGVDSDRSKLSELGVSDLSFHQNLYKPISSRSVGNWRKELGDDIIQNSKSDILDYAVRLGYDLEK